jgi:hypothetical protein
MNLRWSNGLSLAFGSVTRLVLQKFRAPMFCTTMDGSTPHRNEGDYSPRPYWTLVHELDGAALVLILKWCPALWGGDMVLNFLFL